MQLSFRATQGINMSDDNKNHDVTIECIRKTEEKALQRLSVIKTQKEQEIILCSFCGKPQNEVRILIQSETSVTICYECVVFCNKLLNDKDDN